MEIENGQIIIETRTDIKEWLDTELQELRDLISDKDAIVGSFLKKSEEIDSKMAKIAEIQELQSVE